MDEDEYEPTDSDDDYSKEDKLLIDNARKSMRAKDISSDEEVYGFGQSDSDDENDYEESEEEEDIEGYGMDMGSDIEDEEQLPDDRAWGKRKRSFYSTDFVDQDYDGIYQGEEAEKAELEEQEARNIQKRLLEQLNDADFSINEAVDIAETTEATTKQEVIESDLTKLTKRQKLDLLKKESPEFFMLIEDFKEKMEDAKNFLPVINYFKFRVKKSFPALEFLQTKLSLILNYCTNISFYLFLKAKRIPIKNHPILKSLFKYRQLFQQIEGVDNKVIKPQVEEILKTFDSGKHVPLNYDLVTKKTTLKVLAKKKRKKQKKKKVDEGAQLGENDVAEENDDLNDLEEELNEKEEEVLNLKDEKRAITYEMAKNKGLIPKRNKAQRNPRVKHRLKYKKAKIRRRGQVRTPRTEIPVYGGEPTGIKIGLTKSIKLKY